MTQAPQITIKTIGSFLLGNREAIERIANGKKAILLALLFIVSAGLARNYDHHILWKEPLWIGGPIAMSIFSAIFIYGFIKIFGRLESSFDSGLTPPEIEVEYLEVRDVDQDEKGTGHRKRRRRDQGSKCCHKAHLLKIHVLHIPNDTPSGSLLEKS